MLKTVSEKRCRGPDAKIAAGGEFDGVSVCEESVLGDFGCEIARFGWVPGSS
jgi:hypothetical protein